MMMRPTRRRRAFTLIELMVSVAVLTLCLVMLSQIISMASLIIKNCKRQMESLEQSRFSLDRIGIDIDSRIRLNQMPVQFDKAAGNDGLTFYTQNGRSSSNRTAALTSYRIDSTAKELVRASNDVGWTGTTQLPFSPATLPALVDADFQVLSPDVFRLETTFLLKSTQTFTVTPPQNWSDVAAVVVSVVTLDANTRRMMSATQLATLTSLFADAVDGQPVLPAWQTALLAIPQNTSLPHATAASVHIYQRFFYVQ